MEHHLPEIWVKKLYKHLKEIITALGKYLKAQALLILISFIISVIGLYIFKIAGLNVWDKSRCIINTDFALYKDTVIKTPMSKDSKEYKEFMKIYNSETDNGTL